jgi:hypothetical protein
MEKIVLFGDSWSCGEWSLASGNQLEISHPGMGEYLSSHYKVSNFSRGGSSIWQTLYAVRNYIAELYEYDYPIKVVIFQSDAFREKLSEKFDVDYSKIYRECIDIKHFYQMVLEIFYIKLEYIASLHNVEIYLCGGLTDIDTNTLRLYPGVKVLCQSWIKLLDPRHIPSSIPLKIDKDFLPIAKSHKRMDLCDQLIDVSDQNFLFYQELLESDYFGKAFGDFHPNREGHRVMSDYIKNFL